MQAQKHYFKDFEIKIVNFGENPSYISIHRRFMASQSTVLRCGELTFF